MGCCCSKDKAAVVEPSPPPKENKIEPSEESTELPQEIEDDRDSCSDTVEEVEVERKQKRKSNTILIRHRQGFKVISNPDRYKMSRKKDLVFPGYHQNESCSDRTVSRQSLSRTASMSTLDLTLTHRSSYLAEPADLSFLFGHKDLLNTGARNKGRVSSNKQKCCAKQKLERSTSLSSSVTRKKTESDVEKRMEVLRQRYKIEAPSRQNSRSSSRLGSHKEERINSDGDSGVHLSLVDT